MDEEKVTEAPESPPEEVLEKKKPKKTKVVVDPPKMEAPVAAAPPGPLREFHPSPAPNVGIARGSSIINRRLGVAKVQQVLPLRRLRAIVYPYNTQLVINR